MKTYSIVWSNQEQGSYDRSCIAVGPGGARPLNGYMEPGSGERVDFYEEGYTFPALAETSLGATQFFEKIFHLGFNAESLFYCPFGEKEHVLEHRTLYDGRKCFCLCLAGHPNKSTADWLIPFAARFVNPSKIKLCSKIRSLMKPESIEKAMQLKNKMNLKHFSRLEVRNKINGRIANNEKTKAIPIQIRKLIKCKDITWS